MPQYGTTSDNRLHTCSKGIQKVFRKVIEIIDHSVLEGHRAFEVQLAAFKRGASKVKQGKHNTLPSQAVDVAPYPIPKEWGSPGPDRLYNNEEMKERARFYYLAGVAKAVAHYEEVDLRWGGDWDSDDSFLDNSFDDLVHFEER